MASHCAVIVHVGEESESGIRKWEETWFKTTAEDGERGGSSDVRWKTVPQTSGCNWKCVSCVNRIALVVAFVAYNCNKM